MLSRFRLSHQAPLSMGFSKQAYWSGLPCPPPPGDLPDPGIKPAFLMSPALADGFFTTSTIWEAPYYYYSTIQYYYYYSCPLLSMGDWFQDPPGIPKSADAQVPYIKWCYTCM